jgi:hypothetical protein
MENTRQKDPTYVPDANIYAVQGASGDVAKGGTTPDTELTVLGLNHSSVSTVLYDGPTVLHYQYSSIEWRVDISVLPGPHKLTARTTDGYPSTAWIFRVQPANAPELIKLSSRAGNVADGGTTDQTELTLHGMSYPGQAVEIFADSTPYGTATANDLGFWQKTLIGFTTGPHRLHAQTEDDMTSDEWLFTVRVALERPALTRVTDSNGDIVEGGSTVETALTLRGVGTPNQSVEIFDGYLLLDSAPVTGEGFWLITLSGLKPVTHRFRARSQGSLWSASRTVHVLPTALKPVITRMQNINGDVVNGGTSSEPAVTLTGVAEPGATVQIYDGDVFKTTAATAGTSFWKVPLSGLSVGSHRFTARSPAGVSPEAWVVIIVARGLS